MNSRANYDRPEVGVIIVNYNSGEKLLLCIESLLQVDADINIAIVDNASSDNSLSLLKSVTVPEGKLQIIHNEDNLGFAVACNMGARRVTGDYL
ncbi:MAG TPA: dTDP-Rha--alpha-D-GlcNAc-pyrophosphate polyprenol alpha-3-L-rhamnosyltransferase, partial [Planctomycetaceae bacterium]|nr:dTDP-Rha--alpha-D-GlcNAc-pyrophosphate polyprenol alpha-3-L-rhamnosyltransferase [Planctomycetaceae bacterium]